MTDDEIIELIDKLSRPIFLFRMARSLAVLNKPGADKRLETAMSELRAVFAGYQKTLFVLSSVPPRTNKRIIDPRRNNVPSVKR